MSANTIFSERTEISITTLSLADAADATSTAFSLAATNHIGLEIDCLLEGIASSIDSVDVYLLSSTDGGTTYATADTTGVNNGQYVGSITLDETTPVRKRLVAGNVSDYNKLYIVNNSGAALSATEGDCEFYFRAISLADS